MPPIFPRNMSHRRLFGDPGGLPPGKNLISLELQHFQAPGPGPTTMTGPPDPATNTGLPAVPSLQYNGPLSLAPAECVNPPCSSSDLAPSGPPPTSTGDGSYFLTPAACLLPPCSSSAPAPTPPPASAPPPTSTLPPTNTGDGSYFLTPAACLLPPCSSNPSSAAPTSTSPASSSPPATTSSSSAPPPTTSSVPPTTQSSPTSSQPTTSSSPSTTSAPSSSTTPSPSTTRSSSTRSPCSTPSPCSTRSPSSSAPPSSTPSFDAPDVVINAILEHASDDDVIANFERAVDVYSQPAFDCFPDDQSSDYHVICPYDVYLARAGSNGIAQTKIRRRRTRHRRIPRTRIHRLAILRPAILRPRTPRTRTQHPPSKDPTPSKEPSKPTSSPSKNKTKTKKEPKPTGTFSIDLTFEPDQSDVPSVSPPVTKKGKATRTTSSPVRTKTSSSTTSMHTSKLKTKSFDIVLSFTPAAPTSTAAATLTPAPYVSSTLATDTPQSSPHLAGRSALSPPISIRDHNIMMSTGYTVPLAVAAMAVFLVFGTLMYMRRWNRLYCCTEVDLNRRASAQVELDQRASTQVKLHRCASTQVDLGRGESTSDIDIFQAAAAATLDIDILQAATTTLDFDLECAAPVFHGELKRIVSGHPVIEQDFGFQLPREHAPAVQRALDIQASTDIQYSLHCFQDGVLGIFFYSRLKHPSEVHRTDQCTYHFDSAIQDQCTLIFHSVLEAYWRFFRRRLIWGRIWRGRIWRG
ncbi:hypothetical protein EVG20_g5910, partial [Dentipellis fragilis]